MDNCSKPKINGTSMEPMGSELLIQSPVDAKTHINTGEIW
jgi:hypothetical protein